MAMDFYRQIVEQSGLYDARCEQYLCVIANLILTPGII